MKNAIQLSLAVALAVSGLVGCSQSAAYKPAVSKSLPSAVDDMQKTAGTWTLVGGEADGVAFTEASLKNSTLTIKGDAYTVNLGAQGVKKGIQKLDATKSPKQIDAQDSDGPTVGNNLGIYEFTAEGDFRVCFAATGKARPTEFGTKAGSGHFMHLWRRAKAE